MKRGARFRVSHLASTLRVEADEFVAYDRYLAAAAADAGLAVTSPGR